MFEAPLTTQTAAFTIGATDVGMSAKFPSAGYAKRVVANAAGNLAIKRYGDAAFAIYAVLQGQAIDGKIVTVGGTGSGSTAIAVVCES